MECPRPPCSMSEILKLVLEMYGLRVTVIQELGGYRDRNILVSVNKHNLPLPPHIDVSEHDRLLVKITNEIDSSRPEQMDMRNAIIFHLKKAGFPTSGPLLNLQGSYQCLLESVNAETDRRAKHIFRLFEFIPGTTLSSIRMTRSLCREVGRLGGWMNEILMKFPVQIHAGIRGLGNEWSMSQLPNLRSKLGFVKDKDKIPVIEEVITKFETEVLNSEEIFSKGLIHSDIHADNILVTDTPSGNEQRPEFLNCTTEGGHRVTSIIDFGDCIYSMHLFEAANIMCYAMMNKDSLETIEAATLVLSGYLEHMALSMCEMSHLHISICARLVQSFVASQVAKAIDTSNEHSQVYANRTWPMLETLLKLSDDDFLQQVLETK